MSAFNITYLLSIALITPSILFITFSAINILFFDKFLFLIRTACELSITLISLRLFASSVAPDDTRSHIQSDMPM